MAFAAASHALAMKTENMARAMTTAMLLGTGSCDLGWAAKIHHHHGASVVSVTGLSPAMEVRSAP